MIGIDMLAAGRGVNVGAMQSTPLSDERANAIKDGARLGSVVGGIVAGIGGARLWRAHPAAGGILMALFVGLPFGGVVGGALATK